MVQLINPTYYKYKMTRKSDGETKLFYRHEDLFKYYPVPRTTLYRILKGKKSKYKKEYDFERVKMPRLEINEIKYN